MKRSSCCQGNGVSNCLQISAVLTISHTGFFTSFGASTFQGLSCLIIEFKIVNSLRMHAANASGTATAVLNFVSPKSIWLIERAILEARKIPIMVIR